MKSPHVLSLKNWYASECYIILNKLSFNFRLLEMFLIYFSVSFMHSFICSFLHSPQCFFLRLQNVDLKLLLVDFIFKFEQLTL